MKRDDKLDVQSKVHLSSGQSNTFIPLIAARL